MRCNEAERQILASSGALGDTVKDHLSTCTACRDFAEMHRQVMFLGPTEVPSMELDASVLSYAAEALTAGHSGMHHLPKATRRIWLFPVLRAAAAAALVACALIWWYRRGNSAGNVPQVAMHEATAQSEVTWDEAELAWSVLDAEMEAVLSEMGGVKGNRAAISAQSRGGGENSGSALDSLDDRLLEFELELYLDSELLLGGGMSEVRG